MDPLVPWPQVVPLLVATNVASAAWFGPGRGRRAVSAALALVSFLCPLAAEGPPFPLTLLAMAGCLAPIRWLDLWRDRRVHPLGVRLWLFASPFDVRRVVPMPPTFEGRRLTASLGFAALFVALYAALERLGPHPAGAWLLVRWLLGAALVYAMVTGAATLLVVVYHALGRRLPVLHDAPILSRTLAEFWSERWNRSVHGILEQHVFRPLARRRLARFGIAAAFAASALLHMWLVLPGLRDATLVGAMGAFFVVQGGLVLLERRLGVARWPSIAARAWTLAWMAVTTPLFVAPMLIVLGV